MVILFACFLPLYEKKESFHPMFTTLLYTLHMYTGIELSLALVSSIARRLLRVELEAPFDEPYLSTSLQDFWGRRWNIMVTRVLHPTVYDPVVKASSRVVGRKWAPLPAVLATFAVSGAMHELIFYYIKREKPTWERWEPCWDSMCFFLLHGVCLALEIALKKTKPKWRLPKAVSCLLTMAFVLYTGLCLFVPSLARSRAFVKSKTESLAVIHFVKNVCDHLRLPLPPLLTSELWMNECIWCHHCHAFVNLTAVECDWSINVHVGNSSIVFRVNFASLTLHAQQWSFIDPVLVGINLTLINY